MATVSEPIIENIPGGVKFLWCEGKEQVAKVVINRISEDHRQNITGEITINLLADEHGNEKDILSCVRLNLTSERSRGDIAKKLRTKYRLIEWDELIELVCREALSHFRQGEPVVEIWPDENDDLIPKYLLEPILPLNHPTVIFGDYGTGKGHLALVIAYAVQLPFYDNHLRLTTQTETCPCLYLDYEDEEVSFRKRWSALERGFGKGAMPIIYRRMTSPLENDVEQLQALIAEYKVGLVIVDSLGPAARGNLNDTEPAIKYHAALRQLNITSLTLAHNSKDPMAKKRTIFGSVFFTNLARSVWECRNEQEVGEDEMVISLSHRKANLSKLYLPLGFNFSFNSNTIKVEQADLKDTGLSGELPLPWQIKNLLREGSLTMRGITERLGKSESIIKSTLSRMAKKEELIKLPDYHWGLRARGS